MRSHFNHYLALSLSLIILGGAACGGPRPGQPLSNTHWRLVAFGATQQPQAVLAGTTITLKFANADDPVPKDMDIRDPVILDEIKKYQVGGQAGCNQYSAAYGISGETLVIKEVSYTLVLCLGPNGEAIMQQEDRYLAALEKAERFTIGGNRLEIYAAGGQQVLVFRREP
jgi:heat shock protein HslJ